MKNQSCNALPVHCSEYFQLMDTYPGQFCEEQYTLRQLVTDAYTSGEIYTDTELYRHYVEQGKYLGYGEGYEWERFIIGCFLCTFYKSDNSPRWSECLVYMGRGAGKDGLISWLAWCLVSPYNPIPSYDVDICAYNEEQALRPVLDIYEVLDSNKKKFEPFFSWTKERVKGVKNKGYIKGHTNNARGKNGLRSGCVFFNEIHTYENFENINVFTTGLGKKPHPRIGYFTTNGDVMDGPLDELLETAEGILMNGDRDDGFLPFICKLDSKEEVHDPENWHKANPSLRYKPDLLREITKEYKKWKKNPLRLPAFMTMRMNIRQQVQESAVATWEEIKATDKPLDLESLRGAPCVVGIDFASLRDWAAVCFHFKKGDTRLDLVHTWVCTQSPDLFRIKAPYKEWAELGHITLVDAPEIDPCLLIDYIAQQGIRFNIKGIALDSYRYTTMRDYLQIYGFIKDKKDNFIHLYRPTEVIQIVPNITRSFANEWFTWGDNPVLRWAANNTKLTPTKKSVLTATETRDAGNFILDKIEPKSRKTDPFMAVAAAMTIEDRIKQPRKSGFKRIGVKTY